MNLRQRTTGCLLVLLLASTPAALAQDTPAVRDDQAVQAQPVAVVAERRDLTATFRATGRYEAAVLGELRFDPEAYAGKLVVTEVLSVGGRVSAGEPVLRLEAVELEDQFEEARFKVAQAERQLDWARTERELFQAEQVIARERAELALADREQDWDLWQDVNKADRYRSAELDLERYEARLADEEEELRQLEALYAGAKLASQTQDIVLERARRSLAEMRERLAIARREHEQTVEVALPRQERDLQNTLGWQRLQREHAATRMRIQLQQHTASVESAARALDRATQQVEKLELDREGLVLLAEHEGVVTGLDLKPGDTVQPRQTLATLYTATPDAVSLAVPAGDLRLLGIGDRVQVRCAAFGEFASPGVVESIDWAGSTTGKDATFPATVRVEDLAPQVRPGMTAILTAEMTVQDALVLPRSAIKSDDRGSYVTVITDDGEGRRDILVGASNDDWAQVVHGLEAGERVKGE